MKMRVLVVMVGMWVLLFGAGNGEDSRGCEAGNV